MKSSKAPLERKRPLFFLAGLVCALSVTLVSFEWRTPYDFPKIPLGSPEVLEDVTYELPPVTTRKVEKPELKVDMPKVTQETNEIEIVDNEVDESIDSEDFKIPEDLDDLTFSDNDAPEADVVEEIETFKIVEEMPAYPGGDPALLKFVGETWSIRRLLRKMAFREPFTLLMWSTRKVM
jgi:protein TonB